MKPSTMRSFNVDFNWQLEYLKFSCPAPPDMYIRTTARQMVAYYKKMHVNNFWTFATSFNGYAWYPSNIAPRAKDLASDFMGECVDLGHKAGMTVFAYICMGDNFHLRNTHPSMIRYLPETMIFMINSDWYEDYLCAVTDEAIHHAPLDGIVYDWVRSPHNKRVEWTQCEKNLYKQLMGERFPAKEPSEDALVEYERRGIDKMWQAVKKVCHAKGVKIWTNHPFDKVDDPIWNNSNLLKEVDYVLNESHDFGFLNWLEQQVGAHTEVIQNICGWASHDMKLIDAVDTGKYGFFGFAQADPKSILPTKRIHPVNYQNIPLIREFYKQLKEKEC